MAVIILCRLLLVAALPCLMMALIIERLVGETRSTLFMLRCDLLEALHYFRKAWREIPQAVQRGKNA